MKNLCLYIILTVVGSPMSSYMCNGAEPARAANGPEHEIGIKNSGFEKSGDSRAWRFYTQGNADAAGYYDETQQHGGMSSMRLSSRSNFEPNVYGALVQKLDGLKPECKYELTVWIKGESVSHCTIAVGPGWKLRKSLPKGTYDWRSVTFQFETPKDLAGSFPLVFIVEGPTDGIWIDDISLMEDSQN
ncbi:carbohydrate binding domain-containing protein [Coraliomargarita parva]|uniref:carbohydrate binding domain-containing protein n=1 Tax=Coraliomargarita parva TaxID=3014050 RepID=UPI0022B3F352|nr:carbohydrate binding domain-containing protein [Coraliomargarita parva]